MKKNLIPLVALLCLIIGNISCKGNSLNDPTKIEKETNYDVEEIDFKRESIDTTEFISFWKDFRQVVLSKDTIMLASMITDSIDGDCVWHAIFGFEEGNRQYSLVNGRLSKKILIKNMDSIFSSVYIKLLRKYDVSKDIYSPVNKEGKKRYQCKYAIGNEKYSADIQMQEMFDNGIIIARYFMGYYEDTIDGGSFCFSLWFTKTETGIKLYNITCMG